MTTIKFYDADGNEFDTGIEQPNDPDFDDVADETPEPGYRYRDYAGQGQF